MKCIGPAMAWLIAGLLFGALAGGGLVAWMWMRSLGRIERGLAQRGLLRSRVSGAKRR